MRALLLHVLSYLLAIAVVMLHVLSYLLAIAVAIWILGVGLSYFVPLHWTLEEISRLFLMLVAFIFIHQVMGHPKW